MSLRLRLVAAAGEPVPLEAGTPPTRPLLREVLGARLRRARVARGRSLRDVAGDAGVSVGHLSQVERGLAEASSEVLRAVCRALDLPMSALLRAASADLAVVETAASSASGTVTALAA